MSNKRLTITWLVVSLLAIVILAVAAKSLFSPREPLYHGKTVEYWLSEVYSTNQAHAFQVLKQIGPAGIPVVVQAFDRRDSSLNKLYQKLYPNLPDWLQGRLTRPHSAKQIWGAAEMVLLDNPDGRLAVPELIEKIGDRKNPALSYIVVSAGRWAGPQNQNGVPALAGCLQDTNINVRYWAAVGLGQIGPLAISAVPALTGALNDTNPAVEIASAWSLWQISGKTNPAAATLKQVMKPAPSGRWAFQAAVELSQIDPNDPDAIPALIAALQDPYGGVRMGAARTLGIYGPAASTAVPALKKEIENGSPQMRIIALQSLNKIDPAAAAGYEQQ